jgi:hypothetical protein
MSFHDNELPTRCLLVSARRAYFKKRLKTQVTVTVSSGAGEEGEGEGEPADSA